ncbi:MAG: stage III sporulation protein AF [Syntrophomonadaceae bacterium]|nr:stage III sporulation protein AF [Syntrophomonadaceae bacterium]
MKDLEALRRIIQEVALIVVLAGLLEMLLPDNSFKRFVKVVMGLFIMISLLGPASSWLKAENWELNSWNLSADDQAVATVLSTGKKMSGELQAISVREYEERLASQIEAVINLMPMVRQSKVWVSLQAGESIYSLSSISQVRVEVATTAGAEEGGENQEPGDDRAVPGGDGQSTQVIVTPVRPVQISPFSIKGDGAKEPQAEKEQIIRRVKETIQNFYGVPGEKITVEILGQGQRPEQRRDGS